MKIGIGITSFGRNDVFKRTYPTVIRNMPNNAEAAEVVLVLNVEGIARAKNRCLKELWDNKCDYYFLLDDDVEIISDKWYEPYINSGLEHAMYNFKLPGKPANDMQMIFSDGEVTAWTHTRGCMLFITKKTLETVGGFDERYKYDYFHPDFTNRVYNAGLTPYRSMDVVGSDKFFHCLDQDEEVESSIPSRHRNDINDYRLYVNNKHSKAYMEYRK